MPLLRTLGELRLDGGAFPRLLSPRKELVLLAYLARRAPRPVDRAELAELLWEGRGTERARQSLRQALLDLRRALDDALEVEADGIRVRGDTLRLDVAEFEQALERGEYRAAVELWRGEFLAGIESTAGEELRAWIEAEREGLRRQLRAALEQLIRHGRRRADWPEAVEWAERWIDLLPLDERGHYQLSELLLLAGRPAEAQVRHVRGAALLRGGVDADLSIAYLELGSRIERVTARAPPRPAESAAVPTPELVGRESPLAELHSAWRLVLGGGTAAVLIEGEAGIGKTRLADEFLLRLAAADDPPVIASARCVDGAGRTEFGAVAELVQGLAGAPGLGCAPAAALVELARLAPGIGARFPSLPEASNAGGGLAEALVEALRAVSADRPVILFLDDPSLADDASAGVLRSLLRRLPPAVLALATARSGNGSLTAGQVAFTSAPGVRRLKLHPLGPSEVRLLLGSMLELPADQQTDLALGLHAEAGGNPGYTVELLAALMDAGRLRPEGGGAWRLEPGAHDNLPLPITIRESIERRLAPLGAEVRVAVEAAAVLGGEFDPEVVAAVAGLTTATTAAAVDELLTRGLLRRSDGGPATHKLGPAVVGRVAYDLLAPARRDALHRAAAEYFRDRGRRDPAARAAAAYHRGRSNRSAIARRRDRWLGVGVAAALAVAAAAVGFAGDRRPRIERAEVPRVAVLPFDVRGGPGLAYLREGLAELLSAALEGGTLHTIPPQQLLAGLGTADSGMVSPRRAAAVATRLGATEILLGRVIAAGGRIRVRVELLTAADRPVPIGDAEVEGTADEVFALADDLARKLLLQPDPSGGDRMSELAAAGTSSLPALKAFLEGRRELRALRYESAIEAFRRAVAADSTLGLGWHGLAVAYSWTAHRDDALDAAERAVRTASGLPQDTRLILQATREYLDNAPEEAERLYRGAIVVDQQPVDGWYGLGEVLFHYNWARGRPIGLARDAIGAAVRRDRGFGPAAVHLAQLLALDGDTAELASLVGGLLARSPMAARQQRLHVLRAFSTGEAAEQRRIAQELGDTLPFYAWTAAWNVALFGRNLDGAESLARVWAGSRGDFGPVYRFMLADLALARGRRRAALAELARAGVIRPGWELEHRALLAISPALALPRDELAALRTELTAWDPTAERTSFYPHQSIRVPQELRPLTRLYLLGVLSARLNDPLAAEARASEAERLGEGPHGRLARSVGREIRAQAALANGEAAAALRLFEADTLAFPDERVRFSPLYARVSARFARAEALRLAGRYQEALGWYHSIVAQNIHELVYLAPSEVQRGRVYEALRMHPEARRSYRAALELWKDADPAFPPMRAEAARRLLRLEEG